ncbi:MAG: hypothetical protein Q9212_007482 [Teloschistes hypoglaucus]
MTDGESIPNGCSRPSTERAIPLRIWHCTHPRTASNVLAKQFQSHPQLAPKAYTFFDAHLFGPESSIEWGKFKSDKPGADKATYQSSFNELQQFLVRIEQEGKSMFIKEHISFILDPAVKAASSPLSNGRPPQPCPRVVDETVQSPADQTSVTERTNPSVLPDSFMRTLSPIIQVRHPALSVSSRYRANCKSRGPPDIFDVDYLLQDLYAAPRMVFDWYSEHVYPNRKQVPRGAQSWPLVVDGEDLVNDNERVISAICSLANLDVQGVENEWQPVSEDVKSKQPVNVQTYLSTLQGSSGVIKSGYKEGDLSIDKEAKKWTEEFGSEIANRLKEIAEAAMEDYLYLRQYRI